MEELSPSAEDDDDDDDEVSTPAGAAEALFLPRARPQDSVPP